MLCQLSYASIQSGFAVRLRCSRTASILAVKGLPPLEKYSTIQESIPKARQMPEPPLLSSSISRVIAEPMRDEML
jgi:hypothetical protein